MKLKLEGQQMRFVGIVNVVSLIIFVIGLSLFLIVTPKNADDYLYLLHFRDWFTNQGIIFPENGGNIFKAGFPLNESIYSVIEHYKLDNGRLGNIVATFFLILPKWVGSGIAAVCFFFSVFCSFRLAGIEKHTSQLIVPGIFMFTFLLPWWENMGALTYQYNYLFSTFLGVLLIFILRKSDEYSMLKMTLIFIIGLAAGCSHESVSVPIFVGIAAVCLIMPMYRSRANLTALCGLGIGIIYLFMSPGMWVRIGSSGGEGIKFYISPYFLFTALPAVIMTIMVIWRWKKKNRAVFFQNEDNVLLIFSLVSAWVSLAIVMVTRVPFRAGWWGIFISTTGILFLLKNTNIFMVRKYRLGREISAFAMMLTVSLHLLAISTNAIDQRKEMEDIFGCRTSRNSECWFGNIKRLPDLSLQSGITGASFATDGFMYMRNFYAGLDRDTLIYATVIPSELKYITGRSGKIVPGGSGIRVISGHLFEADSRFQDIDGSVVYMHVDLGKGYRVVPMRKYRFKSSADGRYYEYIEPVFGWYSSHFKTIKGIR